MPRRTKGAHLWLRPEKLDPNGKLVRRAAWVILDSGKHIATSCAPHEIASAELKLRAYLTAKHEPARKERDIEVIDVADVLSIYHSDCGPRQANGAQLNARLLRLNEFWGGKKLAEVTGETCRAYERERGSAGAARRELEDLRSAISHHQREGLHRGNVRVVLPRKGQPRDRWLTRDEVARLVRVCLRTREMQPVHSGPMKGQQVETEKRPLYHLAYFILIAVYTGTRAGAILSASPYKSEGHSFVDLENGVFYRLAEGKLQTNKRQPPVPIPKRLLAHMRRWQRRGIVQTHFVEFNGRPIKSVKTAFDRAARLAKLPGKVVPHSLRHTAATWLMQAGVDKWQAAGFLGMSVEMLDCVYGHHHPKHLKEAADSIGYRPQQSLPISLAVEPSTLVNSSQTVELIGGPGRTRTSNQTVMSGRL